MSITTPTILPPLQPIGLPGPPRPEHGVHVRKFGLDGFMSAIIIAAILGSVLPATGWAVTGVDWATIAAIAVLFFLYGARLSPQEALAGLQHWKLHLTILSLTFVAFPLLGLLFSTVASPWLSAGLTAGLLYATLAPSTVQSSIAFTGLAGGNVAGAVVSASASNLLGVILTPLLAMALLTTTGDAGSAVDPGSIITIMLQLLLPFVIGQLSRRWTADFVTQHKKPLKLVDQGSILLVVYAAFSEGIRENVWSAVAPMQLVVVVVACVVLLAVVLAGTWFLARALGFDRADSIAIQFCGSKKSLATGLPMAAVLFAGPQATLMVLPLMIFHQIQLMACSFLASHYARTGALPDQPTAEHQPAAEADQDSNS
ncbi:hypothetical protein CGZ91_10405 [Parenemella sanctibonifatiensis]|uniref:Bile acid:sodium symporter n=2 Tax=Parenemella sanctibonifatiensis TaxID=2016505 RepID=A0A255EKD1_9ACTN|nr:hypothetical protein CGZ91_10405 [Parenemella sanctibonifatiensis]